MEQLTPIDEEPAEDNDEDQPITMIPKIMHTAPSPTTDIPPASNAMSTTAIHNELNSRQHNEKRSTEDSDVTDALLEKENNGKQIIPEVENKLKSSNEKDVNQIESVL